MEELMPLFAIVKDEKSQYIIPKISIEGTKYKTSSFIESIVEAIEEEAKDLLLKGDMGTLTVDAYILLETLSRSNNNSMVESILSNPAVLYQAALFCSIGRMAGGCIPEGVEIETETEESFPNLWNAPAGKN